MTSRSAFLADPSHAIRFVYTPKHSSWLNQIEIYFSIVQRKVLTPNDFPTLAAVAERLFHFERYYESIATPFAWKFTRNDLNDMLAKLEFAGLPSADQAA